MEKMLAYSQPMIPPPMMVMDFGMVMSSGANGDAPLQERLINVMMLKVSSP